MLSIVNKTKEKDMPPDPRGLCPTCVRQPVCRVYAGIDMLLKDFKEPPIDVDTLSYVCTLYLPHGVVRFEADGPAPTEVLPEPDVAPRWARPNPKPVYPGE